VDLFIKEGLAVLFIRFQYHGKEQKTFFI